MKNKKAFEMQFNWVFVLIVGAAILVFFTAIAIKQKGVSEASAGITVLKSVQAIVNSASVSTDTTKIVNIPNSKVEIGCNKISVGSSSKQYGNLILFAPGIVSGDKLLTKTSTFSMPYKVANLLYMTSPQVRYILIGNNELANQVNKSLSSELKKEFYDVIPLLKNENNYKVRFVFFEGFDPSVDLAPFADMPDEDVTALKVSGGNEEKGALNFYQKKGIDFEPKGTSSYIGLSSLLGAVYSDQLENYDCSMQNAFSRLGLIANIYLIRTKNLSDYALVNFDIDCAQIYDNLLAAGSHFSTIKTRSSNFDMSSISEILDAARSLAQKNDDLQLKSCSLIY